MNLLLTGALKYSEEQLNKLKLLGYEITFVQDERVPLEVDVSDIDIVVCNGLFLYNDIVKFKNLKLIQLTSAGLDQVPIDYIKEKDIKLYNAKGVYSIPMAEWVVAKILEIYKKSKQFYKKQELRKWEKSRDLLELTGKTVSIIGFGDVGTEVAKRLKAFGVHIAGVGRKNIESEFLDEYYLIGEIDKVLKKSDIVILTVPLSQETWHLINKEKIRQMKDDCVLINVSRGEIIDEVALSEGINQHKFLGVALDVFGKEPLSKGSPLWSFENVIVTPHNSFVSDSISTRMFDLIYKNLNNKQ